MKKFAICLLVTSFTILTVTTQSVSASNTSKGRAVYEAFCVNCHGVNGAGDGPGSAGLNPKPTNLTDPSFIANLTPQDIERAVIMGKPDTAMKGFGSILTKEDIENLFAYLNALMGK